MARASTSSTINLFLTGMSLCYFWAFLSLYPQIPGLYGPTGILPIHRLHKDHYSKSCASMHWTDIQQNPSLFCLVNDLQISPVYLMELLCLFGVILSFICILSHFIRHNLTFIAFLLLWCLYLSLYLVGQTFLSFQWDILLLECGFLCCFISSSSVSSRYNDIILFLVRWLLFRLMFASFIVKLQSECPAWWGLTALDWHYESTCIPTPAAWYFHHLPTWFNHLSVVAMYIIEGPFAILFILPTHFGSHYIFRCTRLFAAYCNIVLMLLIQFTGNYNYFNVLTIVVTCTCFDDTHLNYVKSKILFWRKHHDSGTGTVPSIHKYVQWMLYAIEIVLWIGFMSQVIHYFSLTLKANNTNASLQYDDIDGWYGSIVNMLHRYPIHSNIAFSLEWANVSASKFIMLAVIFGYINIIFCVIHALITNFGRFCEILCGRNHPTAPEDALDCGTVAVLLIVFVYRLVGFVIKVAVGIYIFHISLVPFLTGIDRHHYTKQYIFSHQTWLSMEYIRNEWYFKSNTFHLVSSYGLFRRMTGVGGRPELEVFVSGDTVPPLPFNEKDILYPPTELRNSSMPWEDNKDSDGGWYRVPFLYKPGDLNDIPGWIAPHQPRLDWQMWFAALSNYQNNAWFISFLYRLITPEQSAAVYDLIDDKKYIYAPGFVAHLKWKKSKEDKAASSAMYSLGDAIYETISIFLRHLRMDNEFGDLEIAEDYYKTCIKKECRRKRKKKKKKKRKRKKQSKREQLLERMDYGYPKYITAILYDYHYTNVTTTGGGECTMDENNGVWWTRERKREYFPVFKYDKLESIRDWLSNNGFLKRPIYDGESELSRVVKFVRFLRRLYRRLYHGKYDAAGMIHGCTVVVLLLRLVHELVQTETVGRPLS